MSDDTRCVFDRVYDRSMQFPRAHRCPRTGSLEHEGALYCKTHYPPNVKARREASCAKYEAESSARHAKWEAQKHAARCADIVQQYLNGNVDLLETILKERKS